MSGRHRYHFDKLRATDPHERVLEMYGGLEARVRDLEAKLDMLDRQAGLESIFFYLSNEVADSLLFDSARNYTAWVSELKRKKVIDFGEPVYFYEGPGRRRRAWTLDQVRQLRALRLRGRKRFGGSYPVAKLIDFAAEREADDLRQRMRQWGKEGGA